MGDNQSHARSLKRKRELVQTIPKRYGRYIFNALAKYGEDMWSLKLIDIAYNKTELDYKENYYIVDVYDSWNREKGYNLKGGGASGKHSLATLKKMGEIQKKVWLRPREREKRVKSMKNAWNNAGAKERRGQIAANVWKRPGYKEKQSKKLQNAWKREKTIENFKKGRWGTEQQREKQSKLIKTVLKKYREENPEYSQKEISRLENLAKSQRKEVVNIKNFIKDLRELEKASYLHKKYNMSPHTLNRRIVDILGVIEITNFMDAKKYFQHNDIDQTLEKLIEINKNPEIKKILKKRIVEKIKNKKEENLRNRDHLNNMKLFLMDKTNVKNFFIEIKDVTRQKDLCDKYNLKQRALNDIIKRILGPFGVNNYKEAKTFLPHINTKEVLRKLKIEM